MLAVVDLCLSILQAIIYAAKRNEKGQSVNRAMVLAGAFRMRTNGVMADEASGEIWSYSVLCYESEQLHSAVKYWSFSAMYLARVVLVAGCAAVACVSFLTYVHRLGYTYHGATYVAALGVDHRMGWLSIGALVAAVESVPVLLVNREWIVEKGVEIPRHQEREKAEWLSVLIAAGIQDLLQCVTNRPISVRAIWYILFYSKGFMCLWGLMLALAAWYYKRRFPVILATFAGRVWIVSVAMVGVVCDIDELMDIEMGYFQAWNYRWAVRDPTWRSLFVG